VFSILTALTLVVSSVFAGGITVSQSLDKTSMAFEDSASFEIILQWDGSQVSYRFDKPLDPDMDRLSVRGFSSSIGSKGSGDSEITTKKYKYTLIPKQSGTGRIEPIMISYVSWPDSIPGEMVTEAMTIRVAEPRPVSSKDNTVITVIVVAAISAIAFTVIFVMYRESKADQVPSRNETEQFLDSLTIVKKESGDDLKRFQSGLYDILKKFILDKYSINAEGLSKAKLCENLVTTGLAEGYSEKIANWYATAQQDKFRLFSG